MEAFDYYDIGQCSLPADRDEYGAWMMMLLAAICCCGVAMFTVVRKWRQPGSSATASSDQGHHSLQQLLLSPPAEVIVFFTRREWDKIAAWIDTLPTPSSLPQLTPTGLHERQAYPTVLHFSVLFQAPPELVQRILRVAGALALVRDTRGETPLVWTARLGSWDTYAAMFLEAAPEAIILPNVEGETAIDFVWDRYLKKNQQSSKDDTECPDRILQLLKCYASYEWRKQQVRQQFCFSPLHVSTQLPNGCTATLLDTLVLRHPAALLQRDAWGRTPLHWAAARRNSTGVQKLLQAAPSAVTVEEASTGRLPLHLAVMTENEPNTGDDPDAQRQECLLQLLRYTPLSLQHCEPVTQLPLFAVASTVETAFRLLRHNPTVLQHRSNILYRDIQTLAKAGTSLFLRPTGCIP